LKSSTLRASRISPGNKRKNSDRPVGARGYFVAFIRNGNEALNMTLRMSRIMSRFAQVFGGRLTAIALILAAFPLVNPFVIFTSASVSPSSHPNIKTRAGTSQNWGGYAAVSNLSSPANGFVNSVTGSWVSPTLTRNPSEDTYVAVWVGIDGFSDATVEQIGTESACVSGVQSNYAWVEFYPGPSRIIRGLTVRNGDTFKASVTYEGGSLFALSITDVTSGQSYSTTYNTIAQRQSAEWVVEAPSSSSQVLPLANFGTINFSNAQFTDNTGTTYAIDGRGAGTYDTINLDDPNGGSAKPSGLIDSAYPQGPSSFSVTYAALSVGVSPTSVLLDVGQSQLFTSSVSDGTPPYTYQWYQNGAPVSGANSSMWMFTAISGGSYTVYVVVKDSAGMQATSNTATVTVNVHDVAITSVALSKTVVGRGYGLNVTVTAADLGSFPETFNVTAYANTTIIASANVTLSGGNSTNITFTWNTTGVAYGDYDMIAYAQPVMGETNTTNNNCTGGLITVSIPGDINGDFKVNLQDLVLLARAYDSKPDSANWNPNADIDDNGMVNLSDLVALSQHYEQQV
jgi:hypothetical protein